MISICSWQWEKGRMDPSFNRHNRPVQVLGGYLATKDINSTMCSAKSQPLRRPKCVVGGGEKWAGTAWCRLSCLEQNQRKTATSFACVFFQQFGWIWKNFKPKSHRNVYEMPFYHACSGWEKHLPWNTASIKKDSWLMDTHTHMYIYIIYTCMYMCVLLHHASFRL